MAHERRVRARTMWIWRLEGFARLALAARDPDRHQVAAEALKGLLYNGPIFGQALDRAGLLAPPPPRRMVPPRGTGPTRQDGQRDPELRGQCTHCLAWANDRRVLCAPCTNWCHQMRKRGGSEAECGRCHRTLMLSAGMCRRRRIVVAETEVDTAQIAMKNGDQLWFTGPHAAGLAVGRLLPGTATLQGRFALKRRRARAKSERQLSEHLLDPAQLELFPYLPRDWTRLDTSTPPALTAAADSLVTDFTAYMRGRGWNTNFFNGSIRTLRIVAGHLGAEAPIQESDIRALASMRADLQGARVINYLRQHGLLAAQPPTDPCIARARHHAAAIARPAFSTAVHTFIDVLLGQGSTSSRTRSPKTVENYVGAILGTLETWIADGLTDPREITRKHIEDAWTRSTATRPAACTPHCAPSSGPSNANASFSETRPAASPSPAADPCRPLCPPTASPVSWTASTTRATASWWPSSPSTPSSPDSSPTSGEPTSTAARANCACAGRDARTTSSTSTPSHCAWPQRGSSSATGAGPTAPTPTSSSPATPPSTTPARRSASAWSSYSSSESACPRAACAWTESSTRRVTAPTPSG